MVEVYYYKLPDRIPIDFEKHLLLADEEYRLKVLRLKSDDKKMQKLYAHLLLKALLYKKFGINPFDVRLLKTQSGKPYIETHEICFNVSHTEGAVAVALSETEVGIDIEKQRTVKDALIDKILSFEERQYIEQGGANMRKRCFFECWTKKEAVAKYYGISALEKTADNKNLKVKHIDIEGYLLSVCSDQDDVIFSKVDLLDDFLDLFILA